eukprot:scaffold1_cov108-Cylindrotheca_fusiformis.AAC.4
MGAPKELRQMGSLRYVRQPNKSKNVKTRSTEERFVLVGTSKSRLLLYAIPNTSEPKGHFNIIDSGKKKRMESLR